MQSSGLEVNFHEIAGVTVLALPKDFLAKFFNNADSVREVAVISWLDRTRNHVRIYPLEKWEIAEEEMMTAYRTAFSSATPEERVRLKNWERFLIGSTHLSEVGETGCICFYSLVFEDVLMEGKVIGYLHDDHLKLYEID